MSIEASEYGAACLDGRLRLPKHLDIRVSIPHGQYL